MSELYRVFVFFVGLALSLAGIFCVANAGLAAIAVGTVALHEGLRNPAVHPDRGVWVAFLLIAAGGPCMISVGLDMMTNAVSSGKPPAAP